MGALKATSLLSILMGLLAACHQEARPSHESGGISEAVPPLRAAKVRDAEVLYVDHKNQTVMLSRGTDGGITQGVILEIVRFATWVARIHVVHAGPDTAVARIERVAVGAEPSAGDRALPTH